MPGRPAGRPQLGEVPRFVPHVGAASGPVVGAGGNVAEIRRDALGAAVEADAALTAPIAKEFLEASTSLTNLDTGGTDIETFMPQ